MSAWLRKLQLAIVAVSLFAAVDVLATPLPATEPGIRVEYVSPALTQPLLKSAYVIQYMRFESAPVSGPEYLEVDNADSHFVWSPTGGYGGAGAMRCTFDKGQVSAGALRVVFGKNPFHRGPRHEETFREIWWRMYVKHDAGWSGNPAKLARATCMAGSDWSQGMIAHVWGGKGDTLCIDPASGITGGRKVTTRYNDFDHLRWLGLRDTQTPIFSTAESGRWVCVESHIKLDTAGQRNGVFELWIDGKLEASRSDLEWHGDWNEYGINALFLENYWNSGSIKKQSRSFSDLVISTAPIGPIVASSSPKITRTVGSPPSAWEAEAASSPAEKDICWSSGMIPGNQSTVTIGASQGKLVKTLVPGQVYWLRLRERLATGEWSAWSQWHAPFRSR